MASGARDINRLEHSFSGRPQHLPPRPRPRAPRRTRAAARRRLRGRRRPQAGHLGAATRRSRVQTPAAKPTGAETIDRPLEPPAAARLERMGARADRAARRRGVRRDRFRSLVFKPAAGGVKCKHPTDTGHRMRAGWRTSTGGTGRSGSGPSASRSSTTRRCCTSWPTAGAPTADRTGSQPERLAIPRRETLQTLDCRGVPRLDLAHDRHLLDECGPGEPVARPGDSSCRPRLAERRRRLPQRHRLAPDRCQAFAQALDLAGSGDAAARIAFADRRRGRPTAAGWPRSGRQGFWPSSARISARRRLIRHVPCSTDPFWSASPTPAQAADSIAGRTSRQARTAGFNSQTSPSAQKTKVTAVHSEAESGDCCSVQPLRPYRA